MQRDRGSGMHTHLLCERVLRECLMLNPSRIPPLVECHA